mgnify:CR=1 FL=1
MRNILIYISFFCLALSSCVEKEATKSDLFAAIPKSSAAIVHSNNLEKLRTEILESKIYLDNDSLAFLFELKTELQELGALAPKDTLDLFLRKRRAVFAISLSGAGKYDLLFVTENGKFSKLFKSKLAEKYQLKTRDYSGTSILTYFDGEKEKFALSEHKGLLVFCKKSSLVEESIRQLNGDYSLSNDEDFARLNQTANSKDLANVFIKPSEIPNWFKTFAPKLNVNFIGQVGTWMELDFQIYHKDLLLSGIGLSSNSPNLISTFNGISAQRSSAEKIIPKNIGLWLSYTFENPEHYYRNYIEKIKTKGSYSKYQKLLGDCNLEDPNRSLLSWMDNEMGLIFSGVAGGKQNKIAYFKSRSEEKAEEELNQISDSSYILGYRNFLIKKLASQNLLPRFYGSLYEGFNKPHYFIYEGFVWMAESEAVLKGLINDLIIDKPLASDDSYKAFNENIPSKSHIKVILSNPGLLDLLSPVLSNSQIRDLEKAKQGLMNLKWAALQMDVKKDLAYINFYLLNEPKLEEEVSREWNTVLEAPAAMAPQFVLNHNNRKYDILVQDKNHLLYQLDRNGKILWKKQLDGKILGSCRQVDLYKNNKLQLVFNTTESLYLVDRLGRDVENFPVKFEEPASAAVGVFNYDKARNYRFIVPMGNKLLNFAKDGKEVKGWKFKEADGNIISRPQLFSLNGKDVILCLSNQGTLYLLNRQGLSRFPEIVELNNVLPPFYVRPGKDLSSSEIIANTKSGELAVINFNGSSDEVFLEEDYPAESFLYFEGKYIFTNSKRLIVKDQDLPWAVDLETEISVSPKVMLLNKEFYAAVFSEDAEEIMLYNKRGELVKGFPVFGQAQFDMGSLKQNGVINIVTSTKDGTVICYEVN